MTRNSFPSMLERDLIMSLSNAASATSNGTNSVSPIVFGTTSNAVGSAPLARTKDQEPNSNHSAADGQTADRRATDGFVDRRRKGGGRDQGERRQFGSSHEGLSEAGRELAMAIDQYKLEHHRRYITCDEMLMVLRTLGYSKPLT